MSSKIRFSKKPLTQMNTQHFNAQAKEFDRVSEQRDQLMTMAIAGDFRNLVISQFFGSSNKKRVMAEALYRSIDSDLKNAKQGL